MRYKVVIEYDGTGFCGWQRQKNKFSIQEAVEIALSKFIKMVAPVSAAGRTDAGVHALGQVVHFEIEHDRYDEITVFRALNFYLKEYNISVIDVSRVEDSFHARFSALSKVYQYKIVNRQSKLAIDRARAWGVSYLLDLGLIEKSANDYLGYHDFNSFRDAKCQAKGSMRTIDEFKVSQLGDLIVIEVRAKSFLHRQVRIMVGTLIDIGIGRKKETIAEILDKKDRRFAGVTAPACGLYLKSVEYKGHVLLS